MDSGQAWLLPDMEFPARPGAYENGCYARGFKCVAGLDEAGRGTWAGPVVAAAVILPRELLNAISDFSNSKIESPTSMPDIKDSKLLTARKRDVLASWIRDRAVSWGVGVVDSQEIDRINILNASLLAMTQALNHLYPKPDCILIDGPHKIPPEILGKVQNLRDVQIDLSQLGRFPRQRAIAKGDRLCLSISAASILAKVERDRIMKDYDRLYPQYGFARHKGYGSASHLTALERHGPTPIHRMSFKPVRDQVDRASGARTTVMSFKLDNR